MKVAVRIYKMSGGGHYNVPEEGDIVKWIVKQGDRVQQGAEICELETPDKGVVVIIAPVAGIITDIAYPVDGKKPWQRGAIAETIDDVPFYDPPFCWIETEEIFAVSGQESVSVSVTVETPVAEKKRKLPFVPLAVRQLMEQHTVSVDDMLLRFPDTTSFGENEIHAILRARAYPNNYYSVPASTEQRSYVSVVSAAVPLARARAKELGIDLATIQGSGPDGLILVKDVGQYVGATSSLAEQAAASPVASSHGSESDEPILLEMSRLLRTIAENMEEANDIPTVDTMPTSKTFDFAPLIAFYQRVHARFAYAMWFPVMVATARVLGQEEFIVFNSFCVKQDGKGDAASHPSFFVAARKRVHMGIAYDRGAAPIIDWPNKKIGGESLRILVIHDAGTKTIAELIRDMQRLLKAAVQKRFDFADVSGYTFIFNNVGAIGHHFGRAKLGKNIGCMLNLGSVDVDTGIGVLQPVFDHRLINGARSTKFIQAIHKEMVERVLPELETHLG